MKVNAKAIFLVGLIIIAILASILVVYLNSIEKGKNFVLGEYEVTSESNGISIVSYKGKSTNYTVPAKIEGKKVVSIRAGAFVDSNVESITFTEDTKNVKLAERAFADTASLKKIVLPANLENIPKYCFNGCTKLEEVVFPKNIKYIGDYAFYGCEKLFYTAEEEKINIQIPATVEEICSYAFYGCKAIDTFTISSKLKTIGNYAFATSGIRKINTYNEDEEIGFETIGNHAFFSTQLYSTTTDELYMPKLQTIGEMAFSSIQQHFKYFRLSESVKTVGNKAFSGNAALQKFVFQQSEDVTEEIELGNAIFSQCNNLYSVSIVDKIKKIPAYMFEGCDSLLSSENLVLSQETSEIGVGAFAIFSHDTKEGSSKILSYSIKFRRLNESTGVTEHVDSNGKFTVKELDKYYSGTSSATTKRHFILIKEEVDSNNLSKKTLVAYLGSFSNDSNSYSIIEGEKVESFKAIMNEDIDEIGACAFAGAMFKTLCLPASINYIGAGAFKNSLIENIYFDAASVSANFVIEEDAFSSMKKADVSCIVASHTIKDQIPNSKLQQELRKFNIELETGGWPS